MKRCIKATGMAASDTQPAGSRRRRAAAAKAKKPAIALATLALLGFTLAAVILGSTSDSGAAVPARPALTALTAVPVRVLPVPKPHMLGTASAEAFVVTPIIPPAVPSTVVPDVAPAAVPMTTRREAVVLAIQQNLKQRGFDPGPPDGRLGPRSRAAVRAFQKACSLAVDGAISDTLIERLVGIDVCQRADTAMPVAELQVAGAIYPRGTLHGNAGRASVRVLQQYLVRRGYAAGPVDGRLGPRTRAAILRFQQACGLPADASGGGSLTQKLIRPNTCPSANAK